MTRSRAPRTPALPTPPPEPAAWLKQAAAVPEEEPVDPMAAVTLHPTCCRVTRLRQRQGDSIFELIVHHARCPVWTAR